MTIQALTLIGPPMIALSLSSWLRDAKLPRWADSLIAFLVVFVTALVWTLIGNKLTGNLIADIMIVASFAGWLITGPMAALSQWLVTQWTSPFAALAEALSPVPIQAPTTGSTVTPRRVPPITLPTTPDLVARNSMLSNDPTWRPTTSGSTVPSQPLQVPSVDAAPTNSAQAATGPLPAAAPQPPQGGDATIPVNGSQGTQIPGADQGGQGLPPNPYSP